MKSGKILYRRNIGVFVILSILIVSFYGVDLLTAEENAVDYWEYDMHGPWVDTVVFNEITDADVAVAALLKGDVDMLLVQHISLASLLVFGRTDNVKIVDTANPKEILIFVNESPNTEHHLSPGAAEACSDQRFRHALSHLIDRDSIVEILFNGMGEPVYSILQESVQGDYANPNIAKFPYNITLANEILDEAGYDDINSDGWRETPTGQELKMQFRYYADKVPEGRVSDYISAIAKEKANLNINSFGLEPSKAVQDFWVNRVFDLYVSELLVKPVDHQWTFERYLGTSYAPVYNPSRHNNTEYDKYVQIMTSTLNETLAIEAAHKALEIAAEDQNVITIMTRPISNVFRTDTLTNWTVSNSTEILMNYWNYLNVRLKSGEIGGTLYVSNNLAGMSTNPTKVQYNNAAFIMTLIYDSLIRPGWGSLIFDSGTSGLAEGWTIEPATVDGEVGQVLTFNLVENATWHDGVPFTSADVKYTLETIIPQVPRLMSFVNGVVRVETPDNYTAKVYMDKQSIFSMMSVGRGVPMLPKHIWEKYIDAGQDPATFELNATDVIGTGPFKWSEWKRGEYCSITRNPNYYMGVSSEEPEPPPEPGWPLPVDPLTVGIIAVIVIIIVGAGIIVIRRRGK